MVTEWVSTLPSLPGVQTAKGNHMFVLVHSGTGYTDTFRSGTLTQTVTGGGDLTVAYRTWWRIEGVGDLTTRSTVNPVGWHSNTCLMGKAGVLRIKSFRDSCPLVTTIWCLPLVDTISEFLWYSFVLVYFFLILSHNPYDWTKEVSRETRLCRPFSYPTFLGRDGNTEVCSMAVRFRSERRTHITFIITTNELTLQHSQNPLLNLLRKYIVNVEYRYGTCFTYELCIINKHNKGPRLSSFRSLDLNVTGCTIGHRCLDVYRYLVNFTPTRLYSTWRSHFVYVCSLKTMVSLY